MTGKPAKLTQAELRRRLEEQSRSEFEGFEDLLGEAVEINDVNDDVAAKGYRQEFINIDLIDPNPNQPRRHFDAEGLHALMLSIVEDGLTHSLTVMAKSDGRYMLISGERRWRAMNMAKENGLESKHINFRAVPCYVMYDMEHPRSIDLAIHAYVANEMAEKLTLTEKAMAILSFKKGSGLSIRDLSSRIGESKSSISRCVKIGEWLEGRGELPEFYGSDLSHKDYATIFELETKLGHSVFEDVRRIASEAFRENQSASMILGRWLNQQGMMATAQVENVEPTDVSRDTAAKAVMDTVDQAKKIESSPAKTPDSDISASRELLLDSGGIGNVRWTAQERKGFVSVKIEGIEMDCWVQYRDAIRSALEQTSENSERI